MVILFAFLLVSLSVAFALFSIINKSLNHPLAPRPRTWQRLVKLFAEPELEQMEQFVAEELKRAASAASAKAETVAAGR